LSARVTGLNAALLDRPELIKLKPYELGWVCTMEPTDLTADLRELRIGADAVSWYRDEIDRCTAMIRQALRAREASGQSVDEGNGDGLDEVAWEVVEQAFIQR
jgi:hypothetical protein